MSVGNVKLWKTQNRPKQSFLIATAPANPHYYLRSPSRLMAVYPSFVIFTGLLTWCGRDICRGHGRSSCGCVCDDRGHDDGYHGEP